MTEQEHFNTSPRVELYEAEVGQDQQRMLIKEPLEVESRTHSTSYMRILKLTDVWKLSEIRVAYVGKIIERTLAGEARMKTSKDRIVERKRVRLWLQL